MKVVFLDIDGVLNTNFSKSKCAGFLGIDTAKVRLLKKIIEATGAEIVLISTWMLNFEVGAYKQTAKECKYLSNKLRSQGLKVYDKINNPRWVNRGEDVWAYIQAHPEIEQYVILDDEAFKGYYENSELKKRWIKTLPGYRDFDHSGLTEDLVEVAIKILNGEFPKLRIQEDFYKEWFCP